MSASQFPLESTDFGVFREALKKAGLKFTPYREGDDKYFIGIYGSGTALEFDSVGNLKRWVVDEFFN